MHLTEFPLGPRLLPVIITSFYGAGGWPVPACLVSCCPHAYVEQHCLTAGRFCSIWCVCVQTRRPLRSISTRPSMSAPLQSPWQPVSRACVNLVLLLLVPRALLMLTLAAVAWLRGAAMLTAMRLFERVTHALEQNSARGVERVKRLLESGRDLLNLYPMHAHIVMARHGEPSVRELPSARSSTPPAAAAHLCCAIRLLLFAGPLDALMRSVWHLLHFAFVGPRHRQRRQQQQLEDAKEQKEQKQAQDEREEILFRNLDRILEECSAEVSERTSRCLPHE